MQKKHLTIILLIAVYVAATAGCAGKQITKSEGASPTQNVSSVKQHTSDEKTTMQGRNQTTGHSNTGNQNAETPYMNERENSNLEDVHFAFDSYVIEPRDRNILKKNADYLTARMRVKVTIEGHCDERGTSEYNMALGQHRADEVRKYLINLGVAGKSMTTVSYGKEKPLDPGHNEEAWAKNRRAHFAVN